MTQNPSLAQSTHRFARRFLSASALLDFCSVPPNIANSGSIITDILLDSFDYNWTIQRDNLVIISGRLTTVCWANCAFQTRFTFQFIFCLQK
jgi:hypothetical protein